MSMLTRHVSVCIATCNQRGYIEQCIKSVLAQEADAALEILVGDDCSDDGTSEIVAELARANPDSITHIRYPKRIGPFENVKALLARCGSEYVAWLDGDDYWLPEKLRRQLDFLDANPGCAAVYTNALTIDEAGNPIGLFNDVGDARFDLAAMLRRGNFLNNSSVLFRRQSIGPWLAIKGPMIDYRAHLLHARYGYLAQIGEPLAAYRVNAIGAMTSTQASNDFVRELYWEAIMDVPRDLVTRDDLAHGIADFLKRVISRALRTRRWELLRGWIPRGFQASPYGALRTGLLVIGAAIRATWRAIVGTLRRRHGGRAIVIRHRR